MYVITSYVAPFPSSVVLCYSVKHTSVPLVTDTLRIQYMAQVTNSLLVSDYCFSQGPVTWPKSVQMRLTPLFYAFFFLLFFAILVFSIYGHLMCERAHSPS
jgi:hypothetical protein